MQKEEEFIALIQDHQGLIHKVTTIYVDNPADRQDLYQDIVYQLWKSFEKFEGRSKISTWMYRVAMNTAIGFIKKAKKSPIVSSLEEAFHREINQPESNFEDQLKLLYGFVHQLNLLDKGLMLLLLEGKKYEEIAEVTGLSVSNVGTRINRIKTKLKEQVKKTASYGD